MGQPGSSKILLSSGCFEEIRNLKEGDLVYSPYGNSYTIERVSNISTKIVDEITRIKTIKGKNFTCSRDHILLLLNRFRLRSGGYSRYQTKFGYSRIDNYSPLAQLVSSPVLHFEEKELPVHPYFTGILLSDGELTGSYPVFANNKPEIIDRLNELKIDYLFSMNRGHNNKNNRAVLKRDTRKAVMNSPLWGISEYSIPEIYKTSSIEQRLELLSGIIDASGDQNQTINCKHLQVAKDIIDVIHSLGGSANLRLKKVDRKNKKYFLHRVNCSFGEYIPKCNISYKIPPVRNIKWKNPRNHGFTIESINQKTEVFYFDISGHSNTYITDNWLITSSRKKG